MSFALNQRIMNYKNLDFKNNQNFSFIPFSAIINEDAWETRKRENENWGNPYFCGHFRFFWQNFCQKIFFLKKLAPSDFKIHIPLTFLHAIKLSHSKL